MPLKLVSSETDRCFCLVDEMDRPWAKPCTIRSQTNHPGWANKKTRPADLWAAIASKAEQERVEFMLAAVNACQGMTIDQLRQFAGGKLAEALAGKSE